MPSASLIVMPRRPLRRRQSQKALPLPFFRLARSIALIVSASKAKHQITNPKFHRNVSPGPPRISNGHVENVDAREQPDSSDEEESDGVVQADFAFFDPKTGDFHGVKVMLQNYLDDKLWNLSGFVDLILAQTTVGTVVKIEEDEDEGVYAVVSALNMGRYKDHKCIMELKDFLLKVCPEGSNLDNLRPYMEELAQDVGLLICQRLVNLPPQLLPPMYDALFDEISWATEDEPTVELRKSFGFKIYLLITRIYMIKNGNRKKAPSGCSEEAIIYIKPEDEIFHKLSLWSFTFSLRTQHVAPHELRNYQSVGLLITVEASKISIFRKELHSLIDDS